MSTVQMTPPKPVQRWQADDYAVKGRFVSDLARPVLELLSPRAGERILDLGCGDGVLTQEIAARGADVLGADLSEELLEAAAAKGLKVQKVDGHALPFKNEFDAVFTNAALHWMRRPELVIAGVHRALRPRGRFAGEFGGHGNVAAIATALRAVGALHGGDPDKVAPWFFPSVAEYRRLLEQGGLPSRPLCSCRVQQSSISASRAGSKLSAVPSSSSSRSLSGGKCSQRSSSCCARRFAMLTGYGPQTTSGSVLPRSGLGEEKLYSPRHIDARFMAEALAYQGAPA
ncbi:MAG TPA: class I SAM-dependent methyltransferase [Methyloceanibacter sp.]|nr:class I SAM-dependent methyltransferase [Methyloceanibacter sp.]